jgi:uncharacterized membrane protein YagU involved in acid resistance
MEHPVSKTTTGQAVVAGLVAGVIFMIAEMVLVGTVGGGSPWGPPRMIAAIAMGKDVLPPPASFDLVVVMVGMLVHFALSAFLGVIFALIADRFVTSTMIGIAAGTVFGLIVYALHFYGMTALFPWFAMARGGISILAHAIFGAVLGWYLYRDRVAITA